MSKSQAKPAAKTAAAPAAAPAAKEEAKEEKVSLAKSRGPRGVPDTAKITVLADKNPKRAGSKAAKVFDCYKTGMSTGEFCDAVEKLDEELRSYATPCMVYDAKHGFISIEGYDPGEIVEARVPKEKAPKAEKAPKEKVPKKDPKAKAQADQEAEEEKVD